MKRILLSVIILVIITVIMAIGSIVSTGITVNIIELNPALFIIILIIYIIYKVMTHTKPYDE